MDNSLSLGMHPQELAPSLSVAGLHRASPSTTLDKCRSKVVLVLILSWISYLSRSILRALTKLY